MSMTAKEYLRQYKSAYAEADRIEERIRKLRLKYAMPSAIIYTDMPKAHNAGGDLSDYASQVEALSFTLQKKLMECVLLEADIMERISCIQSADERTLLSLRYIDGLSWDKIAVRLSMSERTVYYLHGSALQHFPVPS